ncbi:MAG: calcium/proton exchanger [Chloroflexi bacterium]|nr:calcium/proton exchanger [Chloroflexota bacterium]
MSRWLWLLLTFAVGAIVARAMAAPAAVVFSLAALGIIPLAALIGRSTESLAVRVGPTFGGLLNATFGNAAELIITIIALQAGLVALVKASLTGAVIGNSLLVLGAAFLAGGVRHGLQRFDSREAGRHAVMMVLALAALYLPSALSATHPTPLLVQELSVVTATVLLLVYFVYIAYSLLDRADVPLVVEGITAEQPEPPGMKRHREHWPVRTAVLALFGSTLATVAVSEVLVAAVEPMTHQLGWTEFFVGIIVVPIIGNVAEHFSAVTLAARNHPDAAIAIAAGSSTQIALLVAPVLVFISLLIGQPMDLVFHPLELLVLGLSAAVFTLVALDGETHPLEGVQLLALYVMAAGLFFLLPA